jgi:hypothetical protein
MATQVKQRFEIEYRDKVYTCDEIRVNNSTLYRVNFPQAPLHITRANARAGEQYWTAIPLDEKVKHVVQELGAIITTYLNR